MHSSIKKTTLFIAGLSLLIACSKDDDSGSGGTMSSIDLQLETALNESSNGIGKSFFQLPKSSELALIPQDPLNPLTPEKVVLGKLLYHETGLATTPKLTFGLNTYSCASCHHAGAGFQAGIKQGIGEGGLGYGMHGEGRDIDQNYPLDSLDVQPIRTPTVLNAAYQQVMLWNGQFGATGPNSGTESQWTAGTPIETNNLGYEGVEIQAIAGLKVHRMEIDTNFLKQNGYMQLFDDAFPDINKNERYTRETAGLAIAAYERTVMANEAPFQEWLSGESSAMTNQQKEGAALFFGKANCYACHTGPALNSMEFHALGMDDLDGPGVYGTTGNAAENAAKGRGGFSGNTEDEYKFKVPQLYNLTQSKFYGHGGNFTSVKSVIEYKNQAQAQNSNVPQSQLASNFVPLNLSDEEITKLVDFIENALLDPDMNRYEPSTLPSGNCFPNADDQSKLDRGCQ